MPAVFQPQLQQVAKQEYVSDSRSTSTGSRGSAERKGAAMGYSSSLSTSGLPEYEYPVQVVVRNGFIETQNGRPDSLDEFFEDRRIQSSPAVPNQHEDQSCSQLAPEPAPLRRTITTGAQAIMSSVAAAAGDFWTGRQQEYYPATPIDDFATPMQHVQMPFVLSELPECVQMPYVQMPCVLMLSEALPEPPRLGSNEFPTVGSGGHNVGKCKPCAFFHTRGCGNGTQCPFCHLCPQDEKRKRQKDKQAAFREIRRERRQMRL